MGWSGGDRTPPALPVASAGPLEGAAPIPAGRGHSEDVQTGVGWARDPLCLRSLEARLEHSRRPPVWTGVGQWCCVRGGWEWGDQSRGLEGGGESCERGPQGGSAGG